MRKVIRVARESDSAAAEWLEVIDRFDELISRRAGVTALAELTRDVTGRVVGVDDAWNGRRVIVDAPRRDRGPDDLPQAILETIVAERVRGRRSSLIRVDAHEAVVSSVEIGGGRIGAAWIVGGRRTRWRPLDHLATERLAAAVALDALQIRGEEEARSRVDPAAVEHLLGGVGGDDEIGRLARQAQLTPSRSYVAVALREEPRFSASPEAAIQVLTRALASHGLGARWAVMGRIPAAVVEAGPRLEEALAELSGQSEAYGFRLQLGIGRAGPLSSLGDSWREAREALALGSLVPHADHFVHFSDLGILHLLAQIPREEILRLDDFENLTALDARGGDPNDLDLLEHFLDSGTLRKAGARAFLHHTTVEYRLRRIERELGYSLAEPANRVRAKLAITLIRIHRVLGG